MSTKRKASPRYKPYWHYVIMHLDSMAKGHSSPLERLCLRHGFKLVPVENPHEQGVDLNPNLKRPFKAFEECAVPFNTPDDPRNHEKALEREVRARESGYNQGRLDTYQETIKLLVSKGKRR
jgi:hypothetical protein